MAQNRSEFIFAVSITAIQNVANDTEHQTLLPGTSQSNIKKN